MPGLLAVVLLGPLSHPINTSNRLCQGNFLVAAGCEAPLTRHCPVLTLVIVMGEQLGHPQPSKAAGAIMTILLKLTELALYLETRGAGCFIFFPLP